MLRFSGHLWVTAPNVLAGLALSPYGRRLTRHRALAVRVTSMRKDWMKRLTAAKFRECPCWLVMPGTCGPARVCSAVAFLLMLALIGRRGVRDVEFELVGRQRCRFGCQWERSW